MNERCDISEFHVVNVEFTDKKALIQALKDMGFDPQVHDKPQHLYGYQGDQRSQKANIIIPRKQISSASNDWGFESVDGKFQMHISAYDKGLANCGKRVPELMQKYAQNVIQNEVASNPKYTDILERSVDKDGTIRLRIGVH